MSTSHPPARPDAHGVIAAPRPALLPVIAETTTSGDLRRLDAGALSLLQYPATEVESGPAGVYLRLRTADGVLARSVTGPACGGTRCADGTIRTDHDGLEVRTRVAAATSGDGWMWTVDLRSRRADAVEVDLLHTLDVALTPMDAVRLNEQYVAQYLDLTPVQLPANGDRVASTALAVRQNMPGAAAPWAVIGASAPIAQWGTDALQLLDRSTGEGLDVARDLPSERLQHEHTLAALRTATVTLAPGQEWTCRFWGFALADHPAATGTDDRALIGEVRERLESEPFESVTPSAAAAPADAPDTPTPVSLLATAGPLPVRDATDDEVAAFAGAPLRLVEDDGRLLSAFTDRGHLVSAAKERLVLRPHGHIQQVVAAAGADLSTVASTVWMRGVFCSQLTLGHASTGALTTVRRSYLGLERAGGVRLLHRVGEGPWSLLSLPSVWRTADVESEWLYLTDTGSIRVSSRVGLGYGACIDIEVDEGPADDTPAESASPESTMGASSLHAGADRAPLTRTELLLLVDTESDELLLDVTSDGCSVPVRDDAALFADGISRGTGLRTAPLGTSRLSRVRLSRRAGAPSPPIDGRIIPSAAAPYVPRLPRLTANTETPGADGVEAVGEMLAWLAQNASVHFRSPRGLEQYTGGAWGTRDVCQGPVGLLLATDEPDVLRATLLRIFAAQQEDGTWPQWFDYLPGHAGPGLRDSHGDVVYWPLLALGEYLAVTGDGSILGESVAWVGPEEMGAQTPVLDHASRAVDHISQQRTADPRLPAYGHGDWNDSLQPARPELAEHMCSTWTTELEIKALTVLADALPTTDDAAQALAERCRALAAGAAEGLRDHLLVDGELAGYAILDGDDIKHLVHPADTTTGVRHGSLQMIHALADELLEPEQARHHLDLIREHLAGPTGVYLFDRPIGYHGGEMTVFQRAEAATFWGREVGLMYMHAHLRFIEALTHLGEADLAWSELLKAVPIGLEERVRGARMRQANCYYSSSDAVFPDRYVAADNADALFQDSTGFEGGWRVYSSGPGLLLRIIVEDVLGIRRRAGRLQIDPVIPAALDGLAAEIPYGGGSITVRFHRGQSGSGVRELRVNGEVITGTALTARYREAGATIDAEQVTPGDVVEVRVG